MRTFPVRRLPGAVPLLGFLFAVACGGPTGPRDVARLGVLYYHGDSAYVSLPSTVAVGETFTVTARTFGGGCTSKGWTRVDDLDDAVVIRPYDVTREAPDLVCPAILNSFEHTADVTFDEPGEHVVRVRGRRLGRDVDEVVQVDRSVTVEPGSAADIER